VKTDGWESYEVSGDAEEILVEIVLNHKPGTYVVVSEGERPEWSRPLVAIIVPEWGEA
tara:strand:- start:6720 stop:6893 length:174 start_codon:yes stop_codon:yes gene_type:complete